MEPDPTLPNLKIYQAICQEVNERFEQLSATEQAGLVALLPTLNALVQKIQTVASNQELPAHTNPSQARPPFLMGDPAANRQDFQSYFDTIQALRESEERFRRLVELAPYAIAVHTNGVFVYLNPAAQRMYGAESPDPLMGRSAMDFVKPGGVIFEGAEDLGEGVRRSEGEFFRLDGTVSYFEALAVPVLFNGRASVLAMASDMTEFRAAQLRQMRSEERFQILVKSAPVGIVLSRESRILFANEAFLQIFGYPVDYDLRGVQIAQFYSSTIHTLDERARLRLAGHLPPPFEFIGRKLDGSVVNLHLQGTQLQMGDGEAYLAFIFDITAQKETQRQLERYRALAENTNDIMLFVRLLDGRIIDANLAACQAYGYSHSELLNLNVHDLRPNSTLELVHDQMQLANQDGIRFETQHLRKNGEIFPVEVSSQGITLGAERLLLSVIRDTSERTQANRALQESEARYRSLVEGLPDIIYSYSDQRGGLYYSPRVKEILGYSAEELKQSPFLWNQSIHPEDRVRISIVISGLEQFKVFEVEYRISDKAGNWHWFYDRSLRWSEVNGELIIEGIATDITDRKQTEADLYRQIVENTQHTAELEALVEVSAVMRQAQNHTEMIDLMLEQTMGAVHAHGGGLALLDGNDLVIQATAGILTICQGVRIEQSQNIFWRVMRDSTPIFIEDLAECRSPEEDRILAVLRAHISAGILLPVKSGNASIGLLFFGFAQTQHFMVHQKRLITAIAEMTGSALHRMSMTEMLEGMVASRGRDLESIYRVTSAASETLELPAALQNALTLTLKAVEAQIGGIFLLDEANDRLELAAQVGFLENTPRFKENQILDDSLEGWIIQNKKPIYLNDLSTDPRTEWSGHPGKFLAFIGLPMRLRDQVLGVLSICKPGGVPLNLEEVTLLSFIADHLGLVVENVRLFQRAEQHAILEERSRLARELHDSVTQSLYSASLFSAGAKEFAAQGNYKQAVQFIDQIGVISQQALRDMRLLVYELRSPALDAMGLTGALQNRLDAVERRSGINTIFHAAGMPALLPKVEENLYRIALEGLNNSLKHAAANQVELTLYSDGERVCLRLSDNGTGFDLETGLQSGGVGLASMRERTEQLAGSFTITTIPGNGTTIEVCVPIK